MNYLRRVVDWIISLESGTQFRKWVSILVKIVGVFALIGMIVAGVAIIVAAIGVAAEEFFPVSTRVLVVIGSILNLVINLAVGIIIVILYWNRSNRISELGEDSQFTLIPITVILIRLFGEGGFIGWIGTGAQLLVASILGSQVGFLGQFLQGLDIPSRSGVLFGLIGLVGCALIGAMYLIFSYFIAELINMFVNMAVNLQKIETRLSANEDISQ